MKLRLPLLKLLVCLVGLLALSVWLLPRLAQPLYAQEANLDQKKKEIEELQAKLVEIQGQKQTLAKTISYLNTKIQLTQKQVENTQAEILVLEEEVQALSGKIVILDSNLGKLTDLLINRIQATYINSVSAKPIYLLLTSNGLSDFLMRYKYLRVGQKHDNQIIKQLEANRIVLNDQKNAKETKQIELEKAKKKLLSQKTALDQQQREKEAALQLTRNDERKYQDELARALAELEAIQGIISGKGTETEVKQVGEGEKIASVIPSASACSSGAHLHFEVVKNNAHVDPASLLSSKSVVWDNKPDDPFGFSGSWRWPLEDSIRITQGYGMTFYAATMRYYGGSPHTGLDMINPSNYSVMSVKPGKLFRGSIRCGGGTLRYVRVQQDDGYATYYLHVNY